MKIPVFVSCPTKLSDSQELARKVILRLLEEMNLEPRALGRSDYPVDLPLREVFVIARHCSGGVILGFNQFTALSGLMKPGTGEQKQVRNVQFATPWNNLEAGILYSLGLPLLVFRELGISGGVFDPGVTDVFVHDMPPGNGQSSDDLKEVFLKWRGRVSAFYYDLHPAGWGRSR